MKHRLITLAAMGATTVLAGTAHAADGTTSQSQPAPDKHYSVAAGDSLSTIADQFHLASWRPLWNVNTNLSDPDVIHTGDDLVIPSGDTTDRPLPVDAIQAPAQTNTVSYQAARPAAVRTVANYAGGSAGIFERIRARESGGNYATNTGNGYYGAYQYDLGTWNNFGGYARPDLAPAAVQDTKAAQTYAARGWSPWPNTCY
jgi:LysM repeat protein